MNLVRAIYPGTFDPLTNGHLDLIERGSKIFDELIVGILRNTEKDPLFNLAERLDMWAALVRTEDLGSFVEIVEDEIANGASPASRDAYKQAAPPEQTYAGLERYWRKRNGFPETEDGPEGEDTVETPQGSAAEASTHAGRSTRASRWMPPTD